MDLNSYQERRDRLIQLMRKHGGGVALLPTTREVARNADTTYPFRHDSNFYYLCGFPEPEALLVLIAAPTPQTILFCRGKHPEREIWDGFRYGPAAATEAFGIEHALSIEDLDEALPKLLENVSALFYAIGANPEFDGQVRRWVDKVRSRERAGITAPHTFVDVRPLIEEMRVVKDAGEIDTMRRAAQISAAAHVRAMRATRAGLFEFEIEAEILAEFRRRGAQSPAYGSIVASGPNACVLHYVKNDERLRDGDLLLVDAGCELDGYASDITRTFPVTGTFTPAQRDLYELVLAAQGAALKAIAPGRTWNEPHEAATTVLAQGMLDLGLLQGSLSEVRESGSYRKFYMHRTGHWLGMDVHDAGDYRDPGDIALEGAERAWRPLVPGMVLTVEPGIYVRADEGVPEKFWNQGIRIEDDVVVTDAGCDVLSSGVPKTVTEIESVMRS